MSESRVSTFFSTPFGQFLLGLLLLILAPLIINLILAIPTSSMTLTIGDNTYDLSDIIKIITCFVPAILVVEGLRKMGVHI